MVLKRACPCSSRFVPVEAPIGFSGAFSRVGASVFSAHAFSEAAGWRLSNRSEIGLSANVCCASDFDFFSGIRLPTVSLMIEERLRYCKTAGPTERLGRAEFKVKVNFNFLHGGTAWHGETLRVLKLDACFRRHLCWMFFCGGILKAFRRLLQRTPVYGAYKALGHYPDYWYWI